MKLRTRSHRLLGSLLILGAAAALPGAAIATDGTSPPPPPPGDGGGSAPLMAPSPTYYESVVGGASVASLSSPDPTLPSALAIDEATARTSYQAVPTKDGIDWTLRIEGFDRRHEQVDAVYDMVLVAALPVDANGADAFQATQRGFFVEEGTAGATVPLIYGGEKIVLKRNVAIEKTLLPQVSGPNGLPDLAGTGYRWTAWDTIVQRDAAHESVVRANGHLSYSTATGISAPDSDDARMAAYLITWIPGLPPEVAPFSVRMDVVPPSP